MLLTKRRAKQSPFHRKNDILHFRIPTASKYSLHGQHPQFGAGDPRAIGTGRRAGHTGAGRGWDRRRDPRTLRCPTPAPPARPPSPAGEARRPRRPPAGTRKRRHLRAGPPGPGVTLCPRAAAGAGPPRPPSTGGGSAGEAAARDGALSATAASGLPATTLFSPSAA